MIRLEKRRPHRPRRPQVCRVRQTTKTRHAITASSAMWARGARAHMRNPCGSRLQRGEHGELHYFASLSNVVERLCNGQSVIPLARCVALNGPHLQSAQDHKA